MCQVIPNLLTSQTMVLSGRRLQNSQSLRDHLVQAQSPPMCLNSCGSGWFGALRAAVLWMGCSVSPVAAVSGSLLHATLRQEQQQLWDGW